MELVMTAPQPSYTFPIILLIIGAATLAIGLVSWIYYAVARKMYREMPVIDRKLRDKVGFLDDIKEILVIIGIAIIVISGIVGGGSGFIAEVDQADSQIDAIEQAYGADFTSDQKASIKKALLYGKTYPIDEDGEYDDWGQTIDAYDEPVSLNDVEFKEKTEKGLHKDVEQCEFMLQKGDEEGHVMFYLATVSEDGSDITFMTPEEFKQGKASRAVGKLMETAEDVKNKNADKK